tara:strand:+ start:1541 stop:1657 length:117 start_codon:yes stop_codon:yes gene_type:complete
VVSSSRVLIEKVMLATKIVEAVLFGVPPQYKISNCKID